MNIVSSPANNSFTSNPFGTAGTGIDVAVNYAVHLYASVRPIRSQPLGARYRMADIRISFNQAVNNPVVHIVGLGSRNNFSGGNYGFSAELDLISPALTLTRLSGSDANFVVNGSNQIINANAVSNNPCGGGAVCGSVRINGIGITSVDFRVYIDGDDTFNGSNSWNGNSDNQGDRFMVGVSLAPMSALPVNVSNFSAQIADGRKTALLKWDAREEYGFSYFEVERSSDAVHYSIAGIVKAAMLSHYQYNVDLNMSPVQYFKLKMVDMDGSYKYSPVIMLKQIEKNILAIYPNPATDQLIIAGLKDQQTICIISNDGKTLITKPTLNNALVSVNISALASGIYYIGIIDKKGVTSYHKFFKTGY